MAFDYKKEYKEFYMPKDKPSLVVVPKCNYISVCGKGDPNEEQGQYQASIRLLYGIAFTIKMSYKGGHQIDGFFEYVVPPLEGFWWQEGADGFDCARKDRLQFISAIRLPDFVGQADLDWAVAEATRKKKADFSAVELLAYDEGECVQCMRIGPYDKEAATVNALHEFARQKGYVLDLNDQRRHHEIYLSDPRRVAPERLKTVVRLPVRKMV